MRNLDPRRTPALPVLAALILAELIPNAAAAQLKSTPVRLDAVALQGSATLGASGPGSFAILVASATRADNGAPLSGLGAPVGSGTTVIDLPKGWRLETHARPLGDAACPLRPTLFLESQPGVYVVWVSPGSCPWRAGDYSMALQLQRQTATERQAGTGTATLRLGGFDDGLLSNGGFDRDLAGWSTGGVQVTWIGDDAAAQAGSGSASVVIREGVICDAIRQCAPIVAGLYEAAAHFRPATGRQGQGLLGLAWYASADCSGSALNVTEPPPPPPTPVGAWTRLPYLEHSLAGAHSVNVDVGFCKVDGDTLGTSRVDVDQVSLRRIGESATATDFVADATPVEPVIDGAIGEAEKNVAVRLQVRALPATAADQGSAPAAYAWLLVTATRQDNGLPLFELASNLGSGAAPISLPPGWSLETLASPVGVQGCSVIPTSLRNLRPASKGSYLLQVVPANPACRWHRGSYALALRLAVEKGGTRFEGRGLDVLEVP
jgi:hypothetical protein